VLMIIAARLSGDDPRNIDPKVHVSSALSHGCLVRLLTLTLHIVINYSLFQGSSSTSQLKVQLDPSLQADYFPFARWLM